MESSIPPHRLVRHTERTCDLDIGHTNVLVRSFADSWANLRTLHAGATFADGSLRRHVTRFCVDASAFLDWSVSIGRIVVITAAKANDVACPNVSAADRFAAHEPTLLAVTPANDLYTLYGCFPPVERCFVNVAVMMVSAIAPYPLG